MQQAQDQVSMMPTIMATRLMGTMFRGAAPALIIAGTAAIGGLVYGAIKGGQSISKHIQKTKAGDNPTSKLFRDLEQLNLTYQDGDKKGHPIPLSEQVTYYKIPIENYESFEKIAKKQGLPFSKLDINIDKSNLKQSGIQHYEIMVLKKHEGIFNKIRDGIARQYEEKHHKEQEDLNARKIANGEPIIVNDSNNKKDFKEELKQVMPKIPNNEAIHSTLIEQVIEAIDKVLLANGLPSISKLENKDAIDKEKKQTLKDYSKDSDNKLGRLRSDIEKEGVALSRDIDISKIQKDVNKVAISKASKEIKRNDDRATEKVKKIKAHSLSEADNALLNDVTSSLYKEFALIKQMENPHNYPLGINQEALKTMNRMLEASGFKAKIVMNEENKKLMVYMDVKDKDSVMNQAKEIKFILNSPELKEQLKNLLQNKDMGVDKKTEIEYSNNLKSLLNQAHIELNRAQDKSLSPHTTSPSATDAVNKVVSENLNNTNSSRNGSEEKVNIDLTNSNKPTIAKPKMKV